MTPTRTHANDVGSPSLPQLWLGAMLRAFAVLVPHVVSTLWMPKNVERSLSPILKLNLEADLRSAFRAKAAIQSS